MLPRSRKLLLRARIPSICLFVSLAATSLVVLTSHFTFFSQAHILTSQAHTHLLYHTQAQTSDPFIQRSPICMEVMLVRMALRKSCVASELMLLLFARLSTPVKIHILYPLVLVVLMRIYFTPSPAHTSPAQHNPSYWTHPEIARHMEGGATTYSLQHRFRDFIKDAKALRESMKFSTLRAFISWNLFLSLKHKHHHKHKHKILPSNSSCPLTFFTEMAKFMPETTASGIEHRFRPARKQAKEWIEQGMNDHKITQNYSFHSD